MFAASTPNKASLAYILAPGTWPVHRPIPRLPSLSRLTESCYQHQRYQCQSQQQHQHHMHCRQQYQQPRQQPRQPRERLQNKREALCSDYVHPLRSAAVAVTEAVATARRRTQAPTTPKKIKKKSSRYCMVEDCTSRAKHARRCWKHGGSIKCKIPDCSNRAKSKGVCWSHGGGSPCSVPSCCTIAVSNGFCWAHGGGKRCREPGCSRPAYDRTANYCSHHFLHYFAPPTTTA